jgi:Protein of unknown function (DUF4089)
MPCPEMMPWRVLRLEWHKDEGMTVSTSDINTLSQLTDLPIPAQYREGVAVQLTALREQAELVLGLPLEPTVEPAAVFTP